MDDETSRIQKDIKLFEENFEKIRYKDLNSKKKRIIELAKQYYDDSKYYLDKKDYLTSFGCINYGHGLLDAVLIMEGDKE